LSADRVRPAVAADFDAFYGRPPARRVQAVVVEAPDGDVLGIGGVERQSAGLCAFMDVAAGVDPACHRRALVRAAREVLRRARGSGLPVFAVRDREQPKAAGLLGHFGFAPTGGAHHQEIWRCQEHSAPCRSRPRR